jgi:hypothetical protein
LVDQGWSAVLHVEDRRRESGELRYILFLLHECISLSYALFLRIWEPMNLSMVTMLMGTLTLVAMTHKRRCLHVELPLLGRLRLTLKQRCLHQR